ncbi:hypothetical protein MFIFM68171_05525 [Madurella fahalii]|uniref:Uncharacterized protein n=1 Tax=Madurella fahalii TaxID=1157608 RepID=A0ABQ0GCM6_9PEZI
MRQRSYLKCKERKLKETKRAKKREAKKAKKQEIRARHKAKAISKRPKSKPASKNKSNKGKEAEDGVGSSSESSDSDFDKEDYNYIDADISSDESDDSDDEGDEDDQVASALNDVLNQLKELQSKVQAERNAEKDSAIDSAVFENKNIVKLYKAESHTPIENSDLVYKAIIDYLLLRHSPQTPLETPDGTIHYPREHIPGLRIRIEELGYTDKTAATIIATVTTKLLRSLYTIRNTNNSNEVIQLDDRTSLTREDVLIQGISQAVKLGSVSKREEFKARATSDGEPHLGAQYTEYLQDRDIDSGLSYLFAILCQDNSVTVSSDRNGIAHFVIYESPVLYRVATLVHQNKKEGERTLVVVNNPWIQQ